MRMVRHDMIQRRQPETARGANEKHAEHDPIVAVGARVVFLGVRIEVQGQVQHPQRRQQVAVDAAGFVVQVQAAAEGFEVRVRDGPETRRDVFVVFGPGGQVREGEQGEFYFGFLGGWGGGFARGGFEGGLGGVALAEVGALDECHFFEGGYAWMRLWGFLVMGWVGMSGWHTVEESGGLEGSDSASLFSDAERCTTSRMYPAPGKAVSSSILGATFNVSTTCLVITNASAATLFGHFCRR